LMQPASERDCTMVVPRYNCPAKECRCAAAMPLQCVSRNPFG
jgi:hypothetical protein